MPNRHGACYIERPADLAVRVRMARRAWLTGICLHVDHVLRGVGIQDAVRKGTAANQEKVGGQGQSGDHTTER